MQSPNCTDQPYAASDFMLESAQTKLGPLIQNALEQNSGLLNIEVIQLILSDENFQTYDNIKTTDAKIDQKRSWRTWVKSEIEGWKSNTNSAHKTQAPSVEYTALDDSGATAESAGVPESLKSASDDQVVKKAQQKEKRRISEQKRREAKKRMQSLAQQATVKAFSDLTVALPVTAPGAARPQPPSDLEAVMVEFDRMQTNIAGLLQNFQCTLLEMKAKNKRVSREDADNTGPAKSKKPRAPKKPDPLKQSSVTPASPGPLPQPMSQPNLEAQTQPHGKTCKLPHCDCEVKGTTCTEDAGVGSDSSVYSSAKEDNRDVCAECNEQIPTEQGSCTSCNDQTMGKGDETESDTNTDQD